MNEVNKVGSAPPPLTNSQVEEKAPEQEKVTTSASSEVSSEESLLLTELVQSINENDGFAAERAEKIEALKVLYQKGDYEINALQTAEGILNEQL